MKKFITVFFSCLMACITLNVGATPLEQKPEFQKFVATMVTTYHFQRSYLQALFAHYRPNQQVLDKIQHPYEGVSWEKYNPTFITQDRINGGVQYWQRHTEALQYAEKQYGVPASIIVAIVGVETKYGTAKLKYSVFDALTTLSFYYPPRASFFQNELREYLLLAREQHFSPKKIYGSYAGAMGLPQFMPSNYRKLAIAYGGAKQKNLMQDNGTVAVSVANFLRNAGWHKDEPIATPAQVIGDRERFAFFNSVDPWMSLSELESYGVTPKGTFNYSYPAALLRLDLLDGYDDWLVFHNFYVLLHYNTSKLYAMTVYQLAQKINIAKSHVDTYKLAYTSNISSPPKVK